MKKFSDIKSAKKITIQDIDESLKERFANLIGTQITESMGDITPEEWEAMHVPVTICAVSNEEEKIINTLKTQITVPQLMELHNKFDNTYKFGGVKPEEKQEPLYFKDYDIMNIEDSIQYNDKFYNLLKSLCKKHNLKYPIVMEKSDTIQVFCIWSGGDNGGENINPSLKSVAKILDSLESNKEITWTQVLNISIDNCDSLYDFVITFTVNKNMFK